MIELLRSTCYYRSTSQVLGPAEHALGIKRRRRFVRTTDSNHDGPIFPNLYRNVIPDKPDLIWVADITYIRIAVGFCYLAVILDACSRKVVGYAISMRIDTPFALAALQAAIHSRRPARGCIHPTDRGSQGRFSRLRAELARVKMERDILGKATAYVAKGST